MEKSYGKLIICIINYFFSNLISFSYKLEMQNLSWPFQPGEGGLVMWK